MGGFARRKVEEALKRLSNFVDADVLLERNLLACTVRCPMCMSNVRKLPLTLTIPGTRTPLRTVERQRTHTKRLKVVVRWTWEARRAWIFVEPAKIVMLRIEHLLNDSTCFRSRELAYYRLEIPMVGYTRFQGSGLGLFL